MFDYVRADIRRKLDVCGTDRTRAGKFLILIHPGTIAVIMYRFGNWTEKLKAPFLKGIMQVLYYLMNIPVSLLSGIKVMAYTEIGKGLVVKDFTGIFVSAKKIGENCTINPGVTIGNIKGRPRERVIGDDVYFGAGSKVLGDLTIGSHVYIFANSVVISSVPDNSTVLGVPARIVSKENDMPGRALPGMLSAKS